MIQSHVQFNICNIYYIIHYYWLPPQFFLLILNNCVRDTHPSTVQAACGYMAASRLHGSVQVTRQYPSTVWLVLAACRRCTWG